MEGLESSDALATSVIGALHVFIGRDEDSELNKIYKRYSGVVNKAIEKTLGAMEKSGIRIPKIESPLKLVRVALIAFPVLFPAQGEAKASIDAVNTVRAAVEQAVKSQSKEAAQAVKNEEGREAAVESVVGQVERTMRELASDPAFIKKHQEFSATTGLTEPKDFYPLRIVLNNILNRSSVVFERYDLLNDENFKARIANVLKFSPELDDIKDQNRQVAEAKSGNYVLTYEPDMIGEHIEDIVEWLYQQKSIKDLQERVGDTMQLQMFEALIKGNKENPLYARAVKEFDLSFLKHIPWELVRPPTEHEYGDKVPDETALRLSE